MAKLRIQVTEKDIKNGERYSGHACPIALAVRRRLKPEHCPLIADESYIFVPAYEAESYSVSDDLADQLSTAPHLPEAAKRFVYAFDHDQNVKPTAFELEVPDELLR